MTTFYFFDIMCNGIKGGCLMRPEHNRRTNADSRNVKRTAGRHPNEVAKRRRKRRFNEALGKFIPVFVAIIAIVIIVGLFYGNKILERYRYSGEKADLNEYFGVYYDYQVAMIVNNAKVEEKGVYYKDTYYLSQDDVNKYFTEDFYVNLDEQNAFYTTQNEIIRTDVNQTGDYCYYFGEEKRDLNGAPVITNDGKVYFSLEYVKLFADFNVNIYDNPKRMVIYTEDSVLDKADINKDTALRYRGGVKSDILKELSENDTVYVLEEMEDWAKVTTNDGFIGYVEIKRYDRSGTDEVKIEKCEIPKEYDPIEYEGKINMAFHQVFETKASNFTDVNTDAGINVVAPTFFRVKSNEGEVSSIVNPDYVTNAHNAGVKIWAVWTDVDDEVDMSEIFKSYEKRTAFIDTMITLTIDNDLDGINLDFEKVSSSAGEDWGEFLRELSIQTHKNGIVLSVDNYAPTASTVHYKRNIQGQVCDYVIVMGYDEHWASGGVAGSVASIDFVENGIINTINSGVEAKKVINAIPFYTRVWKTKDGEVSADTMGMYTTANWCTEYGVELTWDDTTCQYYGEKEMNSTLYQVWLEDAKSIEAKLSVMEAHNVAGVAEWKLGFDTPEAWEVIKNYINK